MTEPQKKESLPSDSSEAEKPLTFLQTKRLNPNNFTIDHGQVKYDLFTPYPSYITPSNEMLGHAGTEGGEDLFDFLGRTNKTLNILPMAVRWVKVASRSIKALVELPPMVRTILYNPMMKEQSAKTDPKAIKLPFPWTQMAINISLIKGANGKIVPANASIPSLAFAESAIGPRFRKDKKLYHSCLPNVFEYGGSCFESYFQDGAQNLDFAGIIRHVINDYLGTTFNVNLVGSSKVASGMVGGHGDVNVYDKLFDMWSKKSLLEMTDLESMNWPVLNTEYEHYSALKDTDGYYSTGFPVGNIINTKPIPKKISVKAVDGKGKVVAIDPDDSLKYASAVRSLQKLSAFANIASVNSGRAGAKTDTDVQTYKGAIVDTESIKPGEPLPTTIAQTQSNPVVSSLGRKSVTAAETWKFRDIEHISESIDIMAQKLYTGEHPLPPGLRYWNPTGQMIMFERPPGLRNITYYPREKAHAQKIDSSKKSSYKVWVPWTQYWVVYSAKMVISDLWVTTSSESVSHGGVQLGILPLPNVYLDSKICLPGNLDKADDLTGIITTAYNSVWNSNYNMDLVDATRHLVQNLSDYVGHYMPGGGQNTKLYKELRTILKSDESIEVDFLKWWSTKALPSDILKLWPQIPPCSEYSDTEDIDWECGCDPDDCCDCRPDSTDHRRFMSANHMMTHIHNTRMGRSWMEHLTTGLKSTNMTTYDKILKHAQAHSSKSLF